MSTQLRDCLADTKHGISCYQGSSKHFWGALSASVYHFLLVSTFLLDKLRVFCICLVAVRAAGLSGSVTKRAAKGEGEGRSKGGKAGLDQYQTADTNHPLVSPDNERENISSVSNVTREERLSDQMLLDSFTTMQILNKFSLFFNISTKLRLLLFLISKYFWLLAT